MSEDLPQLNFPAPEGQVPVPGMAPPEALRPPLEPVDGVIVVPVTEVHPPQVDPTAQFMITSDMVPKRSDEPADVFMAAGFDMPQAATLARNMVNGEPDKPVEGPTVYTYEQLPSSFTGGDERYQSVSLDLLIKNLRNEVAWNPDVPALLETAYSVVRNIGDGALTKADTSNDVYALLNHTRWDAQPDEYARIDQDGDTLATHNEHHKRMSLHETNLFDDSRQLKSSFEKQGFELKDPTDALLFTAVNTAAHESGHALLSGVSKFLTSKSGRKDPQDRLPNGIRMVATKAYLAAHPEEAITGNWETDVVTHEERFAEGYGNMVLEIVMDRLGYSGEEKDEIVKHFLDKAGVYSDTAGTHPIDNLDMFNNGRAMEQVGNILERDLASGTIGYSMPLSPDRLIKQLRELTGQVQKNDKFVVDVALADWEESVKNGQSEQTRADIAHQQSLRPILKNEKTPPKRRFFKSRK